jgi:hypothetical protein
MATVTEAQKAEIVRRANAGAPERVQVNVDELRGAAERDAGGKPSVAR